MKAYHFFGDTLRDGSFVPAIGEKLIYDGEIEMCEQGFHASKHPFDALQYAPGNNLALVKLSGKIIKQKDKVVASERTIIKRFDAEQTMRDFSKWNALQVIHLWDAPQVVIDFLNGDESKRDVARDAAWDAASYAASYAAWDAAWAARYAASDAARYAARYVVSDAASAAQRKEFKRRVKAEFKTL